MSDNAEEGIARTQAAVAKAAGAAGLKEHHNRNIAHLDERIVFSFWQSPQLDSSSCGQPQARRWFSTDRLPV
jgi:hypothetical protein